MAVVAVVDGGDAPVVVRVGEEHQTTRRWMASSAVVGSGFGDDGVERRGGRGIDGVGGSMSVVFLWVLGEGEGTGRCGRARGFRWWVRTARRWS